MNKNDKLINFKIKNSKLLKKFFEVFLAIFFTFIGIISITSFLMFLNASFGVSFFSCFILNIILSQVYSAVCNLCLNFLGNKMDEIILKEKDIDYKKMEIENVELRFENLSRQNKVQLLNYIKENALMSGNCDEMQILSNHDSLSLICGVKKDDNISDIEIGYSRKRKK